eukprot:9727452-Alexandrium_andersonii.AAC.1
MCIRDRRHREAVWGDQVPDRACLPPAVRDFALAPELRLSDGGVFWGRASESPSPQAQCTHLPMQAQRELAGLCGEQGGDFEFGLERILRQIEGPDSSQLDVMPDVVQGEPPSEPNCFTDGSALVHRGLGVVTAGFGVWLPEDGGEEVRDGMRDSA